MKKDPTARGERGPAPRWNLGRTRTIRVPIAIADALLTIAKEIDKKGTENLTQVMGRLRSTISEGSQSSNFQISPGYSESSGSTHP